MGRYLRRLVGLTTLLILSSSSTAWARATTATANTFFPAIDVSPYFTIYGSQTIQPWRYHFGGYFNYANDPLEVGLAGVRRVGIVDNLLMGNFFASMGITDWFQLGLDVPAGLYINLSALGSPTGASETTLRMSDLRFETKFRLVDIDRHAIGLAILPYLIIPTGSGSRYVGNNSFAGGGKVIVDFNIKNRVQISTNLGYFSRDRVVVFNTLQDDMFIYGLGISVKATDWMDVITETYGATVTSDFFARQSELPLEIDGGFRFHLPKPEGLAITVGGGAGLTFGYGSPNFRAFLGLTYPNPKRVYLPPAPPPVAEVRRKIIITKKIHFEFDKAVIRPISFPILDAVVDILKENPDIRKVRVEGHCDYKGSDAYNVKLSQRRTNAVRDYLMARGIEGDRLVAVGYGESRPIATNETAEGRARNRRVEFTILDQEGVAPDEAAE